MPEIYQPTRVDDHEFFGIVYTFSTAKWGFIVYFNDSVYQDLIADLKTLSQKSYSFGFKPSDLDPDSKNQQDPRIGVTISSIVEDFFHLEGDDAIALFHCDPADGRQRARHVTFKKWHKESHINDTIKMYSKEVPADGVNHYIGFLYHINNKSLQALIEEFDEFTKKLTTPEIRSK